MTSPVRTASLLIFAAILCPGQDAGGVPPAAATENSTNPPAAPAPTAEAAGRAADPTAPVIAPKPEAAAAEKPSAPARGAEKSGGLGQAYVLGPNDVVEIKVWNDAKFNSFYTVGPDGTISMLLVGAVKADGLTVAELTDAIRTKLGAFINEPEVNIQVAKMNSKRYFIYGGVGHPGEFALTEQTTMMDAFANCGGFRDFANTKKIRILRNAVDPKTGKEVPQTLYFNYKDVSHGKHMEQNIVLQNGDRIFVPE